MEIDDESGADGGEEVWSTRKERNGSETGVTRGPVGTGGKREYETEGKKEEGGK